MTFPDLVASLGAPAQGPQPYTPDQMARIRRLLARSALYVDDNAAIRLSVTSSVAVTVSLGVRMGRPDASVDANVFKVDAAANGVTAFADFKIGEGLLYNAIAKVFAGTPTPGQCYVTAELLQSTGPNATSLGMLLGGTPTASQSIGFPSTPVVASTDITPAIRLIVGTLPAVGAEILETVPTGRRWTLLSLSTRFTEGAGLNATPKLLWDDGAGHEIGSVDGIVSIASQSFTYAWLAGLGWALNAQNGLRVQVGFPGPSPLLGGYRIRTLTTNMNVLDQYTAPVYVVQESLEVS